MERKAVEMNAPTNETTNKTKSMSIGAAFAVIIGVWLVLSAAVYLLIRFDVAWRATAFFAAFVVSDIGVSLIAGLLLTLVLGLWVSRRRA